MSESDVSSLITTYQALFVHRADIHALQARNGWYAKKAPVTRELIVSHLRGELTAGFYTMKPDSSVRWLALDGDQADSLEQLQEAWKQLDRLQVPSYLEASRRGAHLWLFFDELPASLARRFVFSHLPTLEKVEIFPKQNQLGSSVRYGNLMRGPLGIHRKSGQRYSFLDPISLKPVSSTLFGMLGYLQEVQRVSAEQLEQMTTLSDSPTPQSLRTEAAPPGVSSGRVSPLERLKQRLGDPYVFISRYVDLNADGKGHCPFHPPDHHPSFAVNRRAGYWTDFHELNPRTGRYVGGDALEFYRKLRGLSYKELIRELESELGP